MTAHQARMLAAARAVFMRDGCIRAFRLAAEAQVSDKTAYNWLSHAVDRHGTARRRDIGVYELMETAP